MTARERHDKRAVRLLLLADVVVLGIGAVGGLAYTKLFGFEVPVFIFGWLSLVAFIALLAHIDHLWRHRNEPSEPKAAPPPPVCPSELDHVYRRDGETVVCTRCAERLTLAPRERRAESPTDPETTTHHTH